MGRRTERDNDRRNPPTRERQVIGPSEARWEVASPRRRQEFVQRFFARIVVDDGWIVTVLPEPELVPLLAARIAQDVRRSGPDRGWDLAIARILEITIKAVEDLLAQHVS